MKQSFRIPYVRPGAIKRICNSCQKNDYDQLGIWHRTEDVDATFFAIWFCSEECRALWALANGK